MVNQSLSFLADLPVVFGTHDQFRGNSTELEWQTSFTMEGMLRTHFEQFLCEFKTRALT
jgi:hypothetical protein